MSDLLFKTEEGIFSYRAGGVLIRQGKVLLQRDRNAVYATVGGHVAFGETAAQALEREFAEETHLHIAAGRLLAVQENFFPWGTKPCHQVHFYYQVTLVDGALPAGETLPCYREDGRPREDLEMVWVPVEQLSELEVYPRELPELLRTPEGMVGHLVSRE